MTVQGFEEYSYDCDRNDYGEDELIHAGNW